MLAAGLQGIEADPKHVQDVIDDALRIADLAVARNVTITLLKEKSTTSH